LKHWDKHFRITPVKMKIFPVSLLVLCIFLPVYPADLNFSLSFSHINREAGLSDDMIFSIYQDPSGYIWIGTSNGLNRYDGYDIKRFYHQPGDPLSLAHNTVTSICEDGRGNLWFATFGGGVSKFIPSSSNFRNYTFSDKSDDPEGAKLINHIRFDSKDRLWIATRGSGVFLMDTVTSEFQNLRRNSGKKQDPDQMNSIMSTFEDSDGTVWIATWGEGLWKYVEENGIIERILPKNSSGKLIGGDYIHTILEDVEKNLWLGTRDQGIIRFNGKKGSFRTLGLEETRQVNMTGKSINTIFADPLNHNLIWIGTVNGLYIYRIFENKFFSYKREDPLQGLSNNYVWSIFRDRSGLLWIGTIGGGVHLEKRIKNYFGSYTSTGREGFRLSSNVIGSIYAEDGDKNKLWVGTIGGGLNRIDLKTGRIRAFVSGSREVNAIAPRYINAILSDPGDPGALFLGTYSGLYRYRIQSNNFEKITSRGKEFRSLDSALVSSLLASPARPGILWAGTEGEGLFRIELKNRTIRNFVYEKKVPYNREKNQIYTIRPSRSSPETLWMGTNSGLFRFDTRNGSFRLIGLTDPASPTAKNIVLSIHESMGSPGHLWLGTWGQGLIRFDVQSGSYTRYTREDGLPNEYVVSILEEPVGRLWIGTQAGLSTYGIKSGLFRNFDRDEGLENNLFRTNVSFRNSEKRIFIGGSKGIDHFLPGGLATNTVVPPVVITGLKIFGSSELPGMDEILKEDISIARQIELPHNYNTITLHFSALDFTSPGKNQFACILEGRDTTWQHLGTRNHITYPDLKPGTYTFTVKGSNSDSVWNEKGKTLKIVIKSSFTRSFLYKILAGIVLAVLISLVLYLWRRLRQISFAPELSMDKLIRTTDITEREAEIIRLILRGKSNREIEAELFISLGTVKNHLYHIYKKLNVRSRTQLISLFNPKERK